MAVIRKLIGWCQTLSLPWRAWHVVHFVDAADEIPNQIPNKGVVIVGVPERMSWAAFDCPCKRRHRLMVNLDGSRRPAWSVTSTKPLTIHPSIDDIYEGQQCHFFVRRGRIRWANSDWRTFI